jgi:hypothetical protein
MGVFKLVNTAGLDFVVQQCAKEHLFAFSESGTNILLPEVSSTSNGDALARELDFPLNATPTELSVEQWLGLYQCFRSTRRPES